MSQQAEFSYEQFENLCGPQLVGSSVPESLWLTIYSKLNKQIFDAGDVFSLAAQVDLEEEPDAEALPYLLVAARDLTQDDMEDQCWLLDHAWTFRVKDARSTLEKNEQLRARVSQMLLGTENGKLDNIMHKLWQSSNHYRIASETQLDEESCWYLMDEVGTAIQRVVSKASSSAKKENTKTATTATATTKTEEKEKESDDDVDSDTNEEEINVAVAPLFYPPANATFSIVWFLDQEFPDDDESSTTTTIIDAGTIISCDVARGIDYEKRVLTASRFDGVWGNLFDPEEEEEEEENENKKRCKLALQKRNEKLDSLAEKKKAKVDSLLQQRASALSQHGNESENNNNNNNSSASASSLPHAAVLHTNGSGPTNVWTDHEKIREFLNLPNTFKIVDDPSQAEIAWSTFSGLPPDALATTAKYVCEFHHENYFCNKQFMALTMQEVLGSNINWLPETFDANKELDSFVGRFLEISEKMKKKNDDNEKKEDNFWISKPACMARSMDMSIADDPSFLLRIGETGPKILCKYLSHPATLRGRKFDLRLVVLARSFHPDTLEIYLHDNVWVRTAATQYSCENFEEFDKHFTAMNYVEGGSKLLNLLHDEFISEFDKEYGQGKWKEIYETKIQKMLREAFVAISVEHGEELETPFRSTQGTSGDNNNSSRVDRRAMYGIDLMLDEELNPYLLEITFSPDIARACEFYPNFVNEVFKTLFEGETAGCHRLC